MPLTLLGRQNPLASTKEQLRILDDSACPPFETRLAGAGLEPLSATGITVFQINVGKLCNQTCRHCHVDAGPDRREVMSREIAELCIEVLGKLLSPLLTSPEAPRSSTLNFVGSWRRPKDWAGTSSIDAISLFSCCPHRRILASFSHVTASK